MSGLIKRDGATYLSIKEGKLVVKKNGVSQIYDGLQGTVTKVDFVKEEYQGNQYEKANIYVNHEGQAYILQMHVDSGYFRNFCNALKNGKPKEEVYIQPSYKKDENGRVSAGCFISQGGKYLKHAHTKDNPGDLPPLEKVTFKGETRYDNTKQLAYWKEWLASVFGEDVVEPEVENAGDDSDVPF